MLPRLSLTPCGVCLRCLPMGAISACKLLRLTKRCLLPQNPSTAHPPPVPSLQLGDAKRILGSLTFIQIVNTLSQVWRERERERERGKGNAKWWN